MICMEKERKPYSVKWTDYVPIVGPVLYSRRNRDTDSPSIVERQMKRIMFPTQVAAALAGAVTGALISRELDNPLIAGGAVGGLLGIIAAKQ